MCNRLVKKKKKKRKRRSRRKKEKEEKNGTFQRELFRSVSRPRRAMSILSVRMLLHVMPLQMFKDEALADTVRLMNIDELIIILGDFNARVGNQLIRWRRALGHHGIGKMDENDQRLLEFSTVSDLTITNTFFALTDKHRVSWCHPGPQT